MSSLLSGRNPAKKPLVGYLPNCFVFLSIFLFLFVFYMYLLDGSWVHALPEHIYGGPVSFRHINEGEANKLSLQEQDIEGIPPNKTLVVASTKSSNTTWIRENFAQEWDLRIYVVDDDTTEYTVAKNVGRESGVYLTYIIDNYYALPQYMVFLHAERYQWHNDDPMYDGLAPVKNLRLENVKEEGYAPLRCAWVPGCPTGLRPNASAADGIFGIQAVYAKAFKKFFPYDIVPNEVGTPCCAQFAVPRERVLLRSLEEYKKMRNWLWQSGDRLHEGRSGRVFEYMWHYIFGQNTTACPDAEECYCKRFGFCDLKCPDQTMCLGRYWLPPWGINVPEGWPEKGLEKDGYPKDRWWEEFYPPEEWDGFTRKKTQERL